MWTDLRLVRFLLAFFERGSTSFGSSAQWQFIVFLEQLGSNIKSTVGLPEVSDSSFSELFSSVECIPTHDAIMSVWSRVPNYFPSWLLETVHCV